MNSNKRFFTLAAFILVLILATSWQASPIQASYQADDPPPEAYDIDIPILVYHNVGLVAPSKEYVTIEQFTRQLDILKAYGYTTVHLQDFMDYRAGKTVPPPHPIIITFDNGFENVYQYAVPELKARNMTASFFIITRKIRTELSDQPQPVEEVEELLGDYMTWSQLADLANNGFEIASHSFSHQVLRNIRTSEALMEFNNSRHGLETNIPGLQVNFFAYPYGIGINDEILHGLLAQAYYQAAVGLYDNDEPANPAISDIWALPRRGVFNASTFDLDLSNPYYFFLRTIDPKTPLPSISVNKVAFYDSWESKRTYFYPGEDVSLMLRASNWGEAVNVAATLQLRANDIIIYDSHAQIPSADRRLKPMRRGENTFLFHWTVPEVNADQNLELALQVYDKPHFCNYYRSDFSSGPKIVKSPIRLSADSTQISLKPGEEKDITFTVANTGLAAGQMILTVSFSEGLSVSSSDPQNIWKSYPVGSLIEARGCAKPCQTSTDLIHEAVESAFPTGVKEYHLTIRATDGAAENQWVKFRLAMNVPEQYTPYPFLYAPMGGKVDQQAYYAYLIPIKIVQ